MYDSQPLEPNPYYERLSNLMAKCNRVLAFEVEGVIYKGYEVDAVKEFIKQNPNKADFAVWLDNNYQILK